MYDKQLNQLWLYFCKFSLNVEYNRVSAHSFISYTNVVRTNNPREQIAEGQRVVS